MTALAATCSWRESLNPKNPKPNPEPLEFPGGTFMSVGRPDTQQHGPAPEGSTYLALV